MTFFLMFDFTEHCRRMTGRLSSGAKTKQNNTGFPKKCTPFEQLL